VRSLPPHAPAEEARPTPYPVIWLAVCRRPPLGIPQIVLVPEGEARLVCHKVVKWPIQGKAGPEPREYGSPEAAVIDLAGAGYSGDLVGVLETLLELLL
jgi:hypothetical protein